MTAHDESFMRLALAMARRGLGRTWPNPAVGAVIVRPGSSEMLARGWTMPGGRPHAETAALGRCGGKADGATLYVTLEPCAHHGKTPPCADAIIAAGVSRVVCGMSDPDPRVSGEGLARLRDAGVDVMSDVLADEVRQVTRGHLLRVTEGRPEITLKLAVDSDGLVAPGDGAPVWVTGEEARARAHLLRAQSDAILVGRGTVEADDPELTCRLPGMEDRSPVRVVLDSMLALPESASLLQTAGQAPVWICCHEEAPEHRRAMLRAEGAEVLTVAASADGRLDISAVVRKLAEQGITRLLVEGGPNVAHSFLEAAMVDRAVLFHGTATLGDGGLIPLASRGLERIEESDEFTSIGSLSVGADMMVIYEKTNAGP